MLDQLTNKYFAAFSKKDLETVAALLDDEFALEDPAVVRVEGKTAALAEIDKIFKSSDRLDLKARNIYVAGQTSIAEFTLDLDAVSLKGVDIIEWRGEKMVELRAYLDLPK